MIHSGKFNLSRIDLNLLTALEALLDEKSVSRAAQRLYIGQPAMSHHLARLRELFDDPLLVRQGSRMLPTRRAQELAPKVRRVLDNIRNEVLPAQVFEPARFNGHLTIGITDYAESLYGDVIVSALGESAPGASISFLLVDRERACSLFRKGQLDLAIGNWVEPPGDIDIQTLYTEQHVCLFDNREMNLKLPLSYQDFLKLEHALINNTGEIRGVVDELLAGQGDKRKVRVTCGRFTTLLRLLPGSRLISVVPQVLAELEQSGRKLSISPCPVPVPDFDICLAWRRLDAQAPLLAWLKSLVAEQVRSRRNELLPDDR